MDNFLEYLSYLQATALDSAVEKINDPNNYDEENKFNDNVLTDDEKAALKYLDSNSDNYGRGR